MVLVIRKLRKYPTITEIRIEHIDNPDFPYNAIKKRKREFIRDLVRYCEKKPDHGDILEICQPILEKSKISSGGKRYIEIMKGLRRTN